MLRSAIYSEGFVGHREVVDKLATFLEAGRLPHAVLFSGPEGVGKFLAARWLAAGFLCPDGGCGTCTTCSRILKELHPDLHVVKAEAGRGMITIGQIRDLTALVGTKPFEGSGKAAIIDDADRMNEESQNAFLKTLEEPPPRTVIVLVSSACDRLLPTIRSRCQRFGFSLLGEEDLSLLLERNRQEQGDFPMKLAEGSPGRLLRLLRIDAGIPRRLFMEFIAAPKGPSPVKATVGIMDWAAQKGSLKQQLRENLKISIALGIGLLRDLAMALEGVSGRRLLNQDLENPLKEATMMYDLPSLFYAIDRMVETSADIMGYVDPSLAVEHAFRSIREARKRG
jgi:DNA polymerase-3 subunit delta'